MTTICAAGPLDDGDRAFAAGDYATAYQDWSPLLAKNDPAAEYAIGIMWQRGLVPGAAADPATARYFIGRSAQHGYVKAMVPLAHFFVADGDLDNAMAWLQLAARNGDSEAAKELLSASVAGRRAEEVARQNQPIVVPSWAPPVPAVQIAPIPVRRAPLPPVPKHCTADMLRDVMGNLTYTCR